VVPRLASHVLGLIARLNGTQSIVWAERG